MKKTVAFILMSLLATGMCACDQKKEKAEVTPAEKAAPAVEHQAAPAMEQAPAAEEKAPESQSADVPSPDAPQGEEHAPATEAAPSQH